MGLINDCVLWQHRYEVPSPPKLLLIYCYANLFYTLQLFYALLLVNHMQINATITQFADN